ncbi:Hsp20/alpha crystallin family protein [Salinadaptatus halalkaliphilus]|uniref:Hsp20/alpha crystallin family protein n=1 Tax=Salinadaptatus halalkaliphilus TaxID=2419781 RepID=A0A4S3TLU1_9EURY|nr:Hsp20/alpha crystallin family protein [Salinadaptatus halalkaliphilus]THE64213.1 Hsp20/alpha crystallin family protein [Salinadaptatus halalkaliphilus]
MTLDNIVHSEDALVRRYQYDDRTVLAVDLGPTTEPSVDVVDDTVIVVVDDDQYELDLPVDANDAHTFIKNGVLSIETEAAR